VQAVRLVRALADEAVPAGPGAPRRGDPRPRLDPRNQGGTPHALPVRQEARNRVKIVGIVAVPALVELLLDEPERRVCELALAVLD
jgi:hypothetical protein